MTGTTHLVLGFLTGLAAISVYDVPVTAELIVVGAVTSAVSSLAPDFDESDSTLARKITSISPKRIKNFLIPSVFAALISLLVLKNITIYLGITYVTSIVLFTRYFVKSKKLRTCALTLIGVVICYVGYNTSYVSVLTFPLTNYTVSYKWLILLGFYVAIVPWTKHRTITHTMWAVMFWYLISKGAETSTSILGLSTINTACFVCHIIADAFTKSKVKPFYPYNLIVGIPLIKVGSDTGNKIERMFIILYSILVATILIIL